MNKLMVAISSPTFWILAGTFAFAGVSAIVPQLSGSWSLIAVAFLAGLGALLHPGEIQKAAGTNTQ